VLQSAPQFVGRLSIETDAGQLGDFCDPHSEQRLLLSDLTRPDVRLAVILKPRQIGASTLNAAHTFWLTYAARDPVKTLIAADVDDTTDAIFQKFHTFNDNLPEALRRKMRRSSRREMVFDDTGAGIRCMTARGKSQAKGFTFQRLIAEEMGFWHKAEDAWASLTATLHEGPYRQTVIISTPNGAGNLFHKQVQRAQAAAARGEPGVVFFFSRWSDHPSYRLLPPKDWRPDPDEQALAARYGLTGPQLYWRHQRIWGVDGIGPDLFPIHYPLTVDEGFESPAGCWFDHDYLKALSAVMEQRYNHVSGEFRVYRKPKKGEAYAIGADPSWCNGGNEAVATVLDKRGRLCAVLAQNRGTEDSFAENLADLAVAYGSGRRTARVQCESNKGGGGSVVLKRLKKRGVWLWQNPDRQSPSFGKDWHTSNGSKAEGYAHLRQMVNGDGLDLYDCVLLNQLKHIREENGTIEGRDGVADDHADALMLAAWNLRTLPGSTARPSRHRRRFQVARPFDPIAA